MMTVQTTRYSFTFANFPHLLTFDSQLSSQTFVMLCTIWYHLYNLKNVKNTHGGVLVLVKLQAEPCNFSKINFSPWVFFTFFNLRKWYQIAQCITFVNFPTS